MDQSVNIPEIVFHIFLFGIESYMYEMDFPFAPTPQVQKKFQLFSSNGIILNCCVCGFDVLYAAMNWVICTFWQKIKGLVDDDDDDDDDDDFIF